MSLTLPPLPGPGPTQADVVAALRQDGVTTIDSPGPDVVRDLAVSAESLRVVVGALRSGLLQLDTALDAIDTGDLDALTAQLADKASVASVTAVSQAVAQINADLATVARVGQIPTTPGEVGADPAGAAQAVRNQLAGYATTTALADGLASKVNSSTYATRQSTIDTAIATKLDASTAAVEGVLPARLTSAGLNGAYAPAAGIVKSALAPGVQGSLDKADAAATPTQVAAAANEARVRANHTGTQTSATISDFTEAAQDAVAALLGAGSNVIVNYDDAANSLTISATGSGGTGLDPEQVRDVIGVAIVGLGPVAVTVNDAADTITITTTATVNATDAALRDRTTHTGVQSADTVVDGTANRVLTAAKDSKLAGITAGATANAADAQLRDRSTHTGTQAASTVTGLAAVATSGAYSDITGPPHITLPTDATTDIGPLIQAAYDSGERVVRLAPNAVYLWDTPVFLDRVSIAGGLVIEGQRATIRLGPNLPTTGWTRSTTTRFAIFPNTLRSALSAGVVTVGDATRATGTGGALRSLIVRDLTVEGQDAYRGFSYANRTSVTCENVVLKGGRVLSTWHSYTDGNAFINCYSRGGSGAVPEQTIIEQYQAGDGVTIIGGKADSSVGFARLKTCRGALFVGMVTGKVELDDCTGVVFQATHQEGQQSTKTMLEISNSQVTISGSAFYENWSSTVPSILINDSGSIESATELILDGVVSQQLHTSATGSSPFSALVEISVAADNTRIVSRNLKGQQVSTDLSGVWVDGTQPTIKAPAVIQTVLDSAKGRALQASGNFAIHRKASGAWTIESPLEQLYVSKRQTSAPAITSATPTSGTTMSGTLVNGQGYSYALAVRDALGNYSAASAETTATPGAAGRVRLILSVSDAPGTLVLWRKSGTGVLAAPEQYVVLGARSARTAVFDTGDYANGRAWVSTDIPVPAIVAATNATRSAVVVNDVPLPTVVVSDTAPTGLGPGDLWVTARGDTTPPTAPSAVTASGGSTGITLTWGAATDDSGALAPYEVYRSDSATRLGTATTTTYLDTTAVTGTAYTYTVRALDLAGNGTTSTPSNSATRVSSIFPAADKAWEYVVADLALADGATATTVPNRVGSGPALVSGEGISGSTSAPVYRTGLRSKPVLVFDGTKDFMGAATSIGAQPRTRVFIGGMLTTGASKTLFGTRVAGANRQVLAQNASTKWNAYAGTNLPHTANTDTGLHVIAAVYNGTSSMIYIDGVAVTGSAGTEGGNGLRIGSGSSAVDTLPTVFTNMVFGEGAEFSRALTTSELDSIRTAAKAKWSELP